MGNEKSMFFMQPYSAFCTQGPGRIFRMLNHINPNTTNRNNFKIQASHYKVLIKELSEIWVSLIYTSVIE